MKKINLKLYCIIVVILLLLVGCRSGNTSEVLATNTEDQTIVDSDEYQNPTIFPEQSRFPVEYNLALYKTIKKYSKSGLLLETTECEYDTQIQTLKCLTDKDKAYVFSFSPSGRRISEESYENGTALLQATYSENDETIMYITYNNDGSIKQKIENQYDDGIRISSYVQSSDGSYSISSYDENGRPKRQTTYSTDGSIMFESQYVNEYNSNGDVIEICTYYVKNGSRELVSRETREYDAQGNNVRSTAYDNNGMITVCVEDVYDSDGKIIKSISYNPDGRIQGEQYYDTDERLTIAKAFDDSGILNYYLETTYLPDGKIISQQKLNYVDDSISSGIVYECEYGNNGELLLEKTTLLPDENITARTEYKYDSNGNRVQSIKYDQNGNCVEITYQLVSFKAFEDDIQSEVKSNLYRVY